jgi:two-component system chemotaxis response regulator CheY
MRRVLVADDDAVIRRVLAGMLARAGFDVATAADGAIALELDRVTAFDIVVVDYNMPTPGLDVVRELRARRGRAPYLVVLTGECDADVRCVEAGADLVLVKPVAAAALRRALAAAA